MTVLWEFQKTVLILLGAYIIILEMGLFVGIEATSNKT